MKWTQVLLWLILRFRLGSFLTLLSVLYIRQSEVFSDTIPTRQIGLDVQFGYPIPFILIQVPSDGQLRAHVLSTLEGALLDVAFYTFIVGVALRIRSEIARTVRARKSPVDK